MKELKDHYKFKTMLQFAPDEETAKKWNRGTFEKIKAFPQKREFIMKKYPEAGEVLCKSYDDFNRDEFPIPEEYDESINWYSVMNVITEPLHKAKRFEYSFGQTECGDEYKFCSEEFTMNL